MTFIDEHADRRDGGLRWDVEPVCKVLSEHGLRIAPVTYYAAKTRSPSPRRPGEEQLKPRIAAVHAGNCGVYAVRKMHAALRRGGVEVGRDQVLRLLRKLGLEGVRRGRP
ncbi:MAG: IS3 family transposase [Frankiaceae bacterium]